MKQFLILLILELFSSIVTSQSCKAHNATHADMLWQQYKEKYNKTYTDYMDYRRRQSWKSNCELIHKHNEEAKRGVHSFTIRDNHLADMSTHQYLREMVKLTKSSRRKVIESDVLGQVHYDPKNIPHEIDWRKKGFITPDYNQKDCGSCYAFSIANAIQAQIYKQIEKLVLLSEQQIVDCSGKMGNYGCAGGSLRNTLRYIDKAGGLMSSETYPYTAKQAKCKFDKNKVLVNLTRWGILPARNEKEIEIAVATIGPVAASINAAPHTFQLYHTGIYDDHRCSSNTVNHAVTIVGYTKDTWILKNWWGKHWGEDGYMRLKRHANRCGIANYVAYTMV